MLDGLRGEESIATLYRREGIVTNLYYRWSKEFLEVGKKQLQGEPRCEATSDEVSSLRKENTRLEELVAEALLENRVLKTPRRPFRSGPGDWLWGSWQGIYVYQHRSGSHRRPAIMHLVRQ